MKYFADYLNACLAWKPVSERKSPSLKGAVQLLCHHPDSFAKLTGLYLSEKLHDPFLVCPGESAESGSGKRQAR